MKVVLGFDRSSKNKMRIQPPSASFDITRKISIAPYLKVSSGSRERPMSSLKKTPATAPTSWPTVYPKKRSHLYRFYFLRQLERVIMGLRLAPLRGAARKMAIRLEEAACASTSYALTALL